MNWPLVAYIAWALFTAEFLHRNGANGLVQFSAGLFWPVYWGRVLYLFVGLVRRRP